MEGWKAIDAKAEISLPELNQPWKAPGAAAAAGGKIIQAPAGR